MNTERDGGYAWVILGATWLNNVLWAGVYSSSSVYMLEWLEVFDTGKAGMGMVGGTQNGINFFSGLFAGPMIDRFGCRCVGIIGTIITVVGLLLTACSTSMIWLYISYGLVVGTGLGWMSMPAILMVQYYFDKKRAFAGGLSLMGQGMGTFVILPILRVFVREYGWRGAMVLHAGLTLHSLLLSSLYIPFDLDSIVEKSEIAKSVKTEKYKRDCRVHKQEVNTNTSEYPINLYSNGKHKIKDNQTLKPGFEIQSKSLSPLNTNDSSTYGHKDKEHKAINPLIGNSEKEITSGHCHDSEKPSTSTNYYKIASVSTMFKKLVVVVKSLWDFSLFKSPVYAIYTFGLVFVQIGQVLFYRFISVKAHESGLSKMHSILLTSIAGLSSTLSRIVFSFVANMPGVNRILQCGVGGLGQGLALFLSAAALSFSSYTAVAVCFGSFLGMHATVATTVMADIMTVIRLSKANTFLSTLIGLAILISLPIAGYIIDVTGDFNMPFYLYGGTGCIASIMILILPVFIKYQGKQKNSTFETIQEKKLNRKEEVQRMYFSVESLHSLA